MSIKAVFFDIDGTLLTDNRTVSQSTIRAINTLKKKGILVGLATGRGPRFLLKYMASLGLDIAVSYNGQYIFSRTKVLFASPLKPDAVSSLMDYARNHQKDLAFGTATGVVGSGILNFGMGTVSSYLTRFVPKSFAGGVDFLFNQVIRRLRPKKVLDIHDFLQEPIYQLILLATSRETQAIAAQFPDLAFTRSSSYATDIINKGNSKLKGIELVGKSYHFQLDQVMAFGDSDNDLEMLAGVKYSVAMGNATAKAKQTASYVTANNNQNGISQALAHFGILDETDGA